jgi:CYTH domain-containing protein
VLKRTAGQGRYARTEREQRWILAGLPDDLTEPIEIHDRYLTGSSLRLRQMRSGSDVVFKLGQKVRVASGSPEHVLITNLYLSQYEFDSLSRLEGASLDKIRWHWPTRDRVLSVDQFDGTLAGLILAEVELSEDDPFLDAPTFSVADVTHEDRFSGGHLAHLTTDEAAALLAHVVALIRERGAE